MTSVIEYAEPADYDSHHNERRESAMPMIDVYSTEGTFSDKHALASDLANAVMRWEKVPPISLFMNNTAAFVHDLPEGAISNAAGDSNYVRVQVLTPVGVLDRDKQLGVVRELTDIVAAAASDPSLVERTWVLITESPEGGWGIKGHANTGEDIAAAAREELTKAAQQKDPSS
jgi:phenylpyruvate tautomerase PptA (4-oxalocrotonate tautomerase family)